MYLKFTRVKIQAEGEGEEYTCNVLVVCQALATNSN